MPEPNRSWPSLTAVALIASIGLNLAAAAVLIRPHLDLFNYYEWSALQNAEFSKSAGARGVEVLENFQGSGFDVVVLYGQDATATTVLANPSTRPYLKVLGPRPSLHLTQQDLRSIQDRVELAPEVETYLDALARAPE